MKLTTPQANELQKEFSAQVIDDGAPIQEQLVQAFGDHTFFINEDGLHVWELVSDDKTSTQQMAAVQIAAWQDDQRSALVKHEPKVFKLLQIDDLDEPDPAA